MSKKIQLTQEKVAVVDDEDYVWLNRFKWTAEKNHFTWYAKRSMPRNNGKRGKIYMHREIMNVLPGMEIDHRDHDGLDNRRTNLRIVDHSQNMMNARMNTRRISMGVDYITRDKQWRARMRCHRVQYTLGWFHNQTDAIQRYIEARVLRFNGKCPIPESLRKHKCNCDLYDKLGV